MSNIINVSIVGCQVTSSHDDRAHTIWAGGCVLASLEHFLDDCCVYRADYEECGSKAIHKVCPQGAEYLK